MPYKRYGRRSMASRRRFRKGGVLKKYRYKPWRSPFTALATRGYLKINRGLGKAPDAVGASPMYIYAGNSAGVYVVQNPQGSNVLLTAPAIAEEGVTNIYTIPCSFKFQLNNLVNYQELVSLFDAYRIRAIEVKLILTQTESTTSDSLPYISYIKDIDSDVPLNTLQEYSGLKFKRFSGNMLTLRWIPKILSHVSNSQGTVSQVISSCKKWVDCVDSNVEYFGMKLNIHNVRLNSTTNRWKIDFVPRLILEFRNAL